MLPPALSPRPRCAPGSAPSSAACAAAQRVACRQSSMPAGNLCSGRQPVIDRDDDACPRRRTDCGTCRHGCRGCTARTRCHERTPAAGTALCPAGCRRGYATARLVRRSSRSATTAISAGGAISAMRASYCARATSTGSVCVRGHPGALIKQRLDLRIDRHCLSCRAWVYCAALASAASRAGRKRSSTCPGPLSSRT